MNRADLKKLSNTRIREAKALFAAEEYSGAYYLAGYAVECALKACFAKGVKRHDFPDKRVRDVFTHDLPRLINYAGLNDELELAKKASTKFVASWDVVCKWTEESRYSTWARNDAEQILDAIARRKDGVLPWIKQLW